LLNDPRNEFVGIYEICNTFFSLFYNIKGTETYYNDLVLQNPKLKEKEGRKAEGGKEEKRLPVEMGVKKL